MLCEILHCGQALGLGTAGGEIVVHESLELGQHVAVCCLTCNELPFVEAHAVVQKQLDVACDEAPAQAVDGMVEFHRYLVEAVLYNLSFIFRQVESLVRRV